MAEHYAVFLEFILLLLFFFRYFFVKATLQIPGPELSAIIHFTTLLLLMVVILSILAFIILFMRMPVALAAAAAAVDGQVNLAARPISSQAMDLISLLGTEQRRNLFHKDREPTVVNIYAPALKDSLPKPMKKINVASIGICIILTCGDCKSDSLLGTSPKGGILLDSKGQASFDHCWLTPSITKIELWKFLVHLPSLDLVCHSRTEIKLLMILKGYSVTALRRISLALFHKVYLAHSTRMLDSIHSHEPNSFSDPNFHIFMVAEHDVTNAPGLLEHASAVLLNEGSTGNLTTIRCDAKLIESGLFLDDNKFRWLSYLLNNKTELALFGKVYSVHSTRMLDSIHSDEPDSSPDPHFHIFKVAEHDMTNALSLREHASAILLNEGSTGNLTTIGHDTKLIESGFLLGDNKIRWLSYLLNYKEMVSQLDPCC